MYRRSGSKSARLPADPEPYRGRLISDEASFAELLDEIVGVDAYAIYTEFHREKTYYPHLALLQIAWDGGIALVDPLAVDPRPLSRLLESPALGILHAADQD